MKLQHKFVEFMPEMIEPGILYISMEYSTAIHKCICGCNNDVVTPISPTDWKLSFDGETISLAPSIGNWSFDCQSHYWIINSEVKFSRKWNKSEIEKGRKKDQKAKNIFYRKKRMKKK
jgi:Family of unknown function (DUF6527)